MSDVIYISSARGGAGATTCAVMLGLALSAEGERTLVIDGDSICANGLEICKLQGMNVYTLADVEEGACRVKQAILQHPSSPNLYILPTLGCKSHEIAATAVKECEPLFDRIICDGTAQSACKRAVLVSDPYSSSINSAKRRGAQLKDGGFNDVSLIANKVNGGLVFDGSILTPQEFASMVRLPLLGVIPEDLNLPLNKVLPSTKKAFSMTAAAVMGKSNKTFGVVKPYLGVTGALKRRLRSRV